MLIKTIREAAELVYKTLSNEAHRPKESQSYKFAQRQAVTVLLDLLEEAKRENQHLDINHLAFSIAHGTFRHDEGGCSCGLCSTIRTRISELEKEEAAAFYDEHYPPPGGFL